MALRGKPRSYFVLVFDVCDIFIELEYGKSDFMVSEDCSLSNERQYKIRVISSQGGSQI
jgi:hypothetical protein